MAVEDFAITKVLLMYEKINVGASPSVASGVGREAYDKELEAHTGGVMVTWMLEPLRSQAVDHWSGTMVHTNRSDKNHQTINCFVHYSYLWAQKSLLFADIQSKCTYASLRIRNF